MMQARIHALLPPLCAATLLTACASPVSEYPSLAVRDAERISGAMTPAPATPRIPPPPAPATVDGFDSLHERLRASHTEFLAALPATRSAVTAARGASIGSEAWSDAEVAIAGLESQRTEATIALADMVAIYVDISSDGEAIATIEPAYQEATAIVRQQDETINELLAQLYP